MIGFDTFLIGLFGVSIFTGLVTEAIKKIYTERNKKYRANTIAGIVAVILSLFVGISYMLLTNSTFTTQIGVVLFALIFLSWLCAMIGYDKVVQAISQCRPEGKD